MTTPAVPPTEPNTGPPRETLPRPSDPFADMAEQPAAPRPKKEDR